MFFCNSGAEANEAAIKLARKRRRGGGFLVAHGGFHGRTYGALSATPQEAKQAPFAPLVPGFGALRDRGRDRRRGRRARPPRVILEVVQGESGVHLLRAEVLRAIREACDAAGALLIFDEVQTGMGRTGTLWAYEQTGVVPDVITVAKGLGGGFPIGALITSTELRTSSSRATTARPSPATRSPPRPPTPRSTSSTTRSSSARVRDRGEHLREGLRELPGVRSVRGVGLMVAGEIDAARRSSRAAR